MLPSEALYPYTAKEARERGELELWRANFRTNCACAGAIELAIHKGFDGMHLSTDCAKSVIDQYGYKRVGFVLANTLQEQSYDGRYHETNKQWSRSEFVGIIRDECIPDWAAEKLAELHGAAVLPAVCGGFCRRQRRCGGRSGEHLDGSVQSDQVGGQQGGFSRYRHDPGYFLFREAGDGVF